MKISLPVVLQLSLLAPSAPLLAQTPALTVTEQVSFEEIHQKAREKNPAGLKFTVDLGGKTRFHRGEPIPIRLNFSSDAPIGFKLEPRNCDRPGRLNSTDFLITDRPQDTPDPLHSYFSTNPFALEV